MRSKIVFGVLLALFVAFFALLLIRPRLSHKAPLSAAATAQPSASSSAAVADSASAAPSGSAAGPTKLLDRPLRIAGLGWESLAPGLLINGGLTAGKQSGFSSAGMEATLSPLDSEESIEKAFARGGADSDGADIIVLPLSSYVASYERIRALNPQIFFVLGWSRGREVFYSVGSNSLLSLPGAGDIRLGGEPVRPATWMGLFLLDLAGANPSRVRIASPGKAADQMFEALEKESDQSQPAASKTSLILTSADAPGLLPLVAVAQASLIESRPLLMSQWARLWLEGEKQIRQDAASAARQIAALPQAPEPLVLVHRLGTMSWASLGDNAKLAGLSGRGALTIELLFQRTWRIWRDANVLSTPVPEASIVSPGVIGSLVRANPSLVDGATSSGTSGNKGASAITDASKPLVVIRLSQSTLDEGALGAELGFLASVFERSGIRVSINRGASVDTTRTQHFIDAVQSRFDIPAGRIVAGRKVLEKSSATIEIFSP